jgi:hypothetical protein
MPILSYVTPYNSYTSAVLTGRAVGARRINTIQPSRAAIMVRQKAGRSSGVREVMRLPSCTTS